MPLHILLVEDDEDDYLLVRDYLHETGDPALTLEWVATYDAGREALARRAHDIALIDYRLGGRSGLDLLHAAGGAGELPPTIILTGAADPAVDAAAQAAGALDYLIKGRLDAPTLERAIRYTLDQSRQRAALAEAQRFLQGTLDALSAHIAVLDERGVVVAANAAWRRFATQSDLPDASSGLGVDYLAVCDAGARADAPGAAEVGAAIRDILAGRSTSFVREDPRHGPRERRWFAVRASRFPGDGPLRVVLAYENVTERYLAEEQTRFQSQLFDQLPVAVIATDRSGIVTHWNAHAATLYGWTTEEALGRLGDTLISVSPDGQPDQTLQDRITEGEVWTGEFPMRRKGGETFPAYVTDAVLRDERGRLAGVVGVAVDISARRRAEEGLRTSEARFRALVQHLGDVIAIIDAEAVVRYVSPAITRALGYTPETFVGTAILPYLHADDFDAVAAKLALALAQPGVPVEVTFRARHRDGSWRWFETSGTNLLDDPAVAGVVLNAREITARVRAEEALRQGAESFASLFDATGEGLLIHEDNTVLAVNSTYAAMVGYEPVELIGSQSDAPLTPESRQEAERRVRVSDGRPYTVTARRRDGTTFAAELAGRAIIYQGRPARLVTVRDITERMAAEEALRQGAESFASVFNATGDGIVIMEAGRIVAVNHAYTALVGYEPSELVGRAALDLVAPAYRAQAQDRVATGYDQPYETVLQCKDGSSVPMEVVGRSISYQGRPARLSTVRDISARKRTEDALRADAARRQVLIETQNAVAAAKLDRDVLMQIVIGHAQSLTSADGAVLELLEGEELVYRAVGGSAAAHVGLRLAVANSLSGYCVRTGKAQRCDDSERDGRVDRMACELLGIRSMLLVPLRYDGRTFGVLKVLAGRPAAFAEGDLETLELLGGVSAAALSHAAAYEEQRALAAALRANEASLAEAQRIAHVGNWEYDHTTGAIHWSDEFFRIAGLAPRSFRPTMRRSLAIVHPDDRAYVAARFRKDAATNATNEIEYRIVCSDGRVRFIHQRTETLCDADGRPDRRFGVVHDVTEQRLLEQQLRHQAFHDALTGLPNRAFLFDRLGQALDRARHARRTCAVLFLDLDRFKDINDTVGHDAGDRLLVAVAERLRGALREGDTLARLGGDEFTALLEQVSDPREAERTAARFLDALALPIVIDGQEYRLTASIGIALGRHDHQRPEDVLRDADIAMYRAKEEGRAKYAVFDPLMQAQLIKRLELERDLRLALERGEFALYYQPIVDLRSGAIAKVEALIRWRHPARGLLAPGEFITVAEEAGLIRAIGRWVLGEACRQTRSWQEAGTPVPIAVNLTTPEFQHPDLVGEVAAALAAAGTEARWLRLEITESLAMRDVAATITTLTALGAMGVAIAIDDFGTGYSSLAYLKRLPVGLLKIDKAFVDGLGTEEEDTAIVAAIITLSHTLGLRVIAEGVETAEQADLLRALGCDQAQGYHFARPLPAAAVGALLAREMRHEHPAAAHQYSGPTTGALRQQRVAPSRPLLAASGAASAHHSVVSEGQLEGADEARRGPGGRSTISNQ